MTDIKRPPMPEPDRQAFERRMLDFGWRNFEGSISGSPPCWYYNNAELNSRWIGWREVVRLNATVPDGWKLVPIAPTDEMVKAAHAHHEGSAYLPHSLYSAMLSAAPAAPQPAQLAGNHRPDRQWYERMIQETLADDFEIGPAFDEKVKDSAAPAAPQPAQQEQQPDDGRL